MRLTRPSARHARRPMLLALVLGVVLVLVGVTGSALVAVTSDHVSNAALSNVVSRDASLVELFVNATLDPSDVDADGPDPERAAELSARLATLATDDGIARIEIRSPDGRVLASDDPDVIGSVVVPHAEVVRVLDERVASGMLIDAGGASHAAGDGLRGVAVVEELLPIVAADGTPMAVVAMWRNADSLLATLEATRRDVMLVTLTAGLILAAMLFFVFRAAQARLSRQHVQLLEATRRDALTGLLNHGTVVATLADELEVARGAGDQIAVALVDVDNFRLFNATHGHDAADEVLLRVADVVREIAGPSAGHVARYGPDEFLLVLTGATVADAEIAAEGLRERLDAVSVRFGDSEDLPVSVSIGIAGHPAHASAVTELLSAATVALSEAKASGGDGVATFQAGEEERVVSGSFDVLHGLVIAVDTKDRYTKRHSEDVARYAAFLARRLGLDEDLQRTIHLAGLLHDVGKIGIPDVILRKPSKLTAEEYAMFQQHVVLGDAIVRDVPNAELVRAGIRSHHERWDGKGYVENLEGEEIPVIGRLLAVADAFSAMTTTRPYRKALSTTEALKRLEDAAGSQLEEELVAAFVEGIETAADAPLPGEEPAPALWRPELWVA